MVASAAALAIATTSAIFGFGTSMRVGALQDWPELIITERTPPVTAVLQIGVLEDDVGHLPPSSWLHALDRRRGVLRHFDAGAGRAGEGHHVDIRMRRHARRRRAGPSPLTRLNTPAGTPAASMISAKIWAENGAISDGFSTMVQPTASAGATLQAIWLIGQFHGVMKPQTPIGSLAISVVPRCGSSNL